MKKEKLEFINTDFLKKHHEKFIPYVLEKDEISVVLKSHLYLEQAIDKLVIKSAQHPELLLKESFIRKVNFLYSVGAIPQVLLERLCIINTIRNKFSHNFGYKLSSDDLVKVSKLVGPPRDIIPERLLSFPRAKESIIFAGVASGLASLLGLLLETDGAASGKILSKAIEDTLKTGDW